jgi:hypothetical protein
MFVGFTADEVTLLIEMIVDLGSFLIETGRVMTCSSARLQLSCSPCLADL